MNNTEPLTYKALHDMAVKPSERGAYSDSPLGEDIGLHVHGDDRDVHVYVAGVGKVAEVWPDHTDFLEGPQWLSGNALEVYNRLVR